MKKFNPTKITKVKIQAQAGRKEYWEIEMHFSRRPKLKGKVVGLLVVLLACHLTDIQITGPYSIEEDKNQIGV